MKKYVLAEDDEPVRASLRVCSNGWVHFYLDDVEILFLHAGTGVIEMEHLSADNAKAVGLQREGTFAKVNF